MRASTYVHRPRVSYFHGHSGSVSVLTNIIKSNLFIFAGQGNCAVLNRVTVRLCVGSPLFAYDISPWPGGYPNCPRTTPEHRPLNVLYHSPVPVPVSVSSNFLSVLVRSSMALYMVLLARLLALGEWEPIQPWPQLTHTYSVLIASDVLNYTSFQINDTFILIRTIELHCAFRYYANLLLMRNLFFCTKRNGTFK